MNELYIWDNLLIGIERMLAQGLPYDVAQELRIVFVKAFEEKRISENILAQFDKLFEH
jgi:hypothetical protein